MNRRLRRYWRSVLVVALLLVAALVWNPVWVAGQGSWQYPGWSYRREVTVTNNTASALTDYQVMISLTSANFDFSHANSDGSDVRFTYWNGASEVEIPYWIEQWDSGAQQAKVWTKVPTVPGSGSSTIYLYYGNSGASSASNGDATFDIFEDFDVDDGEWTEYDPHNKIELDYTTDHRLEFTNWIRREPGYVYKLYSTQNFVLDYDVNITGYGGNANVPGTGFADSLDLLDKIQNGVYSIFYAWQGRGAIYAVTYLDGNMVWGYGTGETANRIDIGTNTVYYVRLMKFGNTVTLSIFSDVGRTTHIAGSPKTVTTDFSGKTFGYFYLVTDAFNLYDWEWTSGWMDNYKVRKYTDPEPTAVVGAETTPAIVTKCDVDGDGDCDIFDIIKIARYLVGLETLNAEQLVAADVNEDGTVDIADIIKIANYLVGNISALSAQPTYLTSRATRPVKLEVESKSILPGESTNIQISATPGLAGLQVGPQGSFTFNPSVIQVIEVRGIGPYRVLATKIDNQAGQVKFVAAVLGEEAKDRVQVHTFKGAQVPFVELEVRGVGEAGQSSLLMLSIDAAVNRQGQKLKIEAEPGWVVLGEAAPLQVEAIKLMTNSIRRSHQAMRFIVEGKGIRSVEVEIFNLAGRRVFAGGEVLGNTLEWRLRNDQGKVLANGVYLYVLTVRGFDEKVIRSPVKKLVILK